jgi:hypothetical protein
MKNSLPKIILTSLIISTGIPSVSLKADYLHGFEEAFFGMATITAGAIAFATAMAIKPTSMRHMKKKLINYLPFATERKLPPMLKSTGRFSSKKVPSSLPKKTIENASPRIDIGLTAGVAAAALGTGYHLGSQKRN